MHESHASQTSSRREFVFATAALWHAALLRAGEHVHSTAEHAPYTFQFLSLPEIEMLRILIARIVPADDRSGGALGAHVDEYIDFVLVHADPPLQQQWKNGLREYGQVIKQLEIAGIDRFLTEQAVREFAPVSDMEKFFVMLKAATVEGFYTSQQGIVDELGYKGMAFVLDFEGCTHTYHKVPAGWRPSLKQAENV
jgi:gluconate 2-dehydrogenase subunit 3-like protein